MGNSFRVDGFQNSGYVVMSIDMPMYVQNLLRTCVQTTNIRYRWVSFFALQRIHLES